MNFNFIEIMERIALIIETDTGSHPYDKQIAKELGLSNTQYANNKIRNKIPFPEIALFCDSRGITINWVLFAQSSMNLIEREEDVYKIRLIDKINASCGGGNFDDEDATVEYIYIDKFFANKLGIHNSNNLEAINVVGDSMSPTIEDNSIVLLDRSKNTLQKPAIYVVRTIQGLFAKRLVLNSNGYIDLLSDNTEYPLMSMLPEEITIMGEVIGILSQQVQNYLKRENTSYTKIKSSSLQKEAEEALADGIYL